VVCTVQHGENCYKVRKRETGSVKEINRLAAMDMMEVIKKKVGLVSDDTVFVPDKLGPPVDERAMDILRVMTNAYPMYTDSNCETETDGEIWRKKDGDKEKYLFDPMVDPEVVKTINALKVSVAKPVNPSMCHTISYST